MLVDCYRHAKGYRNVNCLLSEVKNKNILFSLPQLCKYRRNLTTITSNNAPATSRIFHHQEAVSMPCKFPLSQVTIFDAKAEFSVMAHQKSLESSSSWGTMTLSDRYCFMGDPSYSGHICIALKMSTNVVMDRSPVLVIMVIPRIIR